MAENTQGTHLLAAKDFVAVVDAEGNDLPGVPKHWGADQLAPGAKKKSGRSSSSSSSSTSSTPAPSADSGTEPAGNASREVWAEYATTVKGATEQDLVDDKGEPLGRDEIRTKYGTPSAS